MKNLLTWSVADVVLLSLFYRNDNPLTVYLLVDLFFMWMAAFREETNRRFQTDAALSGLIGLGLAILYHPHVTGAPLWTCVVVLSSFKSGPHIMQLTELLVYLTVGLFVRVFSCCCNRHTLRARLRVRRVVSQLRAPAEPQPADNRCSICMDGMPNAEECKELPCHHVFHKDCIAEWVDGQGEHNCPNCRAPIVVASDA